MEEDEREALLHMSPEKVQDMAEFCNKYPSLSLNYEVS